MAYKKKHLELSKTDQLSHLGYVEPDMDAVEPTITEYMQSKQVPVEKEVEFDVLSFELESLYERRFEEGYNLSIDPIYNQWLKKKHPELSITDQPSHSGYVCKYLRQSHYTVYL